jgi:hypothetical protein
VLRRRRSRRLPVLDELLHEGYGVGLVAVGKSSYLIVLYKHLAILIHAIKEDWIVQRAG